MSNFNQDVAERALKRHCDAGMMGQIWAIVEGIKEVE